MERLQALEWAEPAAADAGLLFGVFAEHRAEEFAPLGLPAEQLQALLAMQYEARNRSYAAAYPDLQTWILRLGAVSVGSACLAEDGSALALVDIGLLNEYRGQGLGTAFLRSLQGRGKPIVLRVASTNPAAKLYLRLGFTVTGEVPPYLSMIWLPAAQETRYQ